MEIARPSFVREEVPLAPRTTLEVGGAARYLAEIADEGALAAALRWAATAGLPVHVLGGGSNLVVADAGFDGLVVDLAPRGLDLGADGTARIAAGEPWDAVVAATVEAGLAGLECLSGIPGRAGAAPIQNIGAYGQEVGEVVERVRAWDRVERRVVELDAAACDFGYRSSRFKRDAARRHVVLGLTLRLRPGGAPTVRYPDLQRRLGAEADLARVRETVLAVRREKSMVIDAADPNRRSAGSFFLNPVVAPATAQAVARRVGERGIDPETMPRWAVGAQVKLSAAWLIDRAGLARGMGDGPVGLSTRHTLALVNRGGATAGDLVRFAGRVRRTVRDAFGVELVPEPVFLGFAAPAVQVLDALTDD